MGLRKIMFRLHHVFEHRIKHISTFLSGIYGFIFGCILLCCDYFTNLGMYIDSIGTYTRLVSIATILISIIIGISLTTFSVIFVVMQLASSQFSPRILRHFLANDIKIQKFIGFFIGTLTLCILPQIASAFFNGIPFLITLSTGVFFAMKSLVWSYPRMITYLSENMNVAAITDKIKQEVLHEINEIYLDDWAVGKNLLYKRLKSSPENKKILILSSFESGYLESIDYIRMEKLIAFFIKENPEIGKIITFQKPVVGEFIMKNTSVLLIIEHHENDDAKKIEHAFSIIASETFRVNKFRSYTQDVNFGVRKLVDIAIKAISPAVNDPTTCLNCIDQLGEIIKVLSEKQFPSTETIALHKNNIIINEFNFDERVDFSFDQIFQWGKEDPTVVKRLVRTIRLLVTRVKNPYCLKVLIQEVEDMNLLDIYNEENYKNRNLKISKEKLITIRHEFFSFKEKAVKQIHFLNDNGFMKLNEKHEYNANAEIVDEEKKAIDYLKQYALEK